MENLVADVQKIVDAVFGSPPHHLERLRSRSNDVFRVLVNGKSCVVKMAKGKEFVSGFETEVSIYSQLGGRGIPLPRLLGHDLKSTLINRPWFVVSDAGPCSADDMTDFTQRQRDMLMFSLGATLGRIHRVDLPKGQTLALDRRSVCTRHRHHLGAWYEIALEKLKCRPQFEEKQLELLQQGYREIPAIGDTSLCHGDYAPPQCIREQQAVVSVIDWERAWVGGAADDLATLHAYLSMYYTQSDVAEALSGYRSVRPLPDCYAACGRVLILVRLIAVMYAHDLVSDSETFEKALRCFRRHWNQQTLPV